MSSSSVCWFVVLVGFMEVGGFEAAMFKYMSAIPNTTIVQRMTDGDRARFGCGIPPDNSLHFFRAADDDSLPWPGVIFGLSIISVWYWCTDQVRPAVHTIHFVTLLHVCVPSLDNCPSTVTHNGAVINFEPV